MKRFFFFLLLTCAFLSASAQKRGGNKVKRPAVPVKTKTAGTAGQDSKLFKQMLESTAKVMFIDSVVVDKNDFLSKVPLNRESGEMRLSNPKADFRNQLGSFENEFGDRRIIAKGDSAHSALYTETLLGNSWSKPALISDFDATAFPLQNYPFLASDGVTLFFSAEGPESVGGRDIFMSTFDSDKAQWYKPQNYGLPFNSTANDYLLAIDDLDTLGWLVTDRRQPQGKVCIYTFVPMETRVNFDDDDLDDSELASFARIENIKATWKFGNRNAALKRRNAMLARLNSKKSTSSTIYFVVNDNTVITSPSQFRNPESAGLYKQVQELEKMISETTNNLEDQRLKWHDGDHSVGSSILKMEKDLAQQKTDKLTLEKRIRRLELNK